MKTRITLAAMLLLFTSISEAIAQNLPSYVPTNGLIGWWSFSGNANDSSGNGNNGVVTGATLVADRHGNSYSAYQFNGTTDYIEVADTPALRLNATDFTFSFWVNISTYNASSATAFIVKRAAGNASGWLLVANDFYSNTIELKTSAGQDPNIRSDSTIAENGWHHVAVVYHQSSTLDFYIDGILSSIHSSGGLYFNPNTNSVMRFGHDTSIPPGNYFINGMMDDIGIWNRALTPQEILNLFTGTISSVTGITMNETSIHPNPANDALSIKSNDYLDGTTYNISDLTGKTIISGVLSGSTVIDLNMLKAGVYVIYIDNKERSTFKFIKQ